MNNTWLQYIDRKRFVLMGFFLMLIKTYIHTKLVGFSFRHAMIFWKNNYIMWCLQHDISSVNFLMHPSQTLLLHYLFFVSKNQNELRLFLHWQLILVERQGHLRLPGVKVCSKVDAEAVTTLLSVFRVGLEHSLDSNIKTRFLKTVLADICSD